MRDGTVNGNLETFFCIITREYKFKFFKKACHLFSPFLQCSDLFFYFGLGALLAVVPAPPHPLNLVKWYLIFSPICFRGFEAQSCPPRILESDLVHSVISSHSSHGNWC